MRLHFDLEVGPLRITFDPYGQMDDDAEPDSPDDGEPPAIQGLGAAESTHEYGAEHRGPELQAGHRDPWYDDGGRWAEQRRRTGFSPKGTP